MGAKRLDEVRPGMWVQRGSGNVDQVTAVLLRTGGQVELTVDDGDPIKGPGASTIEVAASPPKVGATWDAGEQLWRLTIDTSDWVDATPLEVNLDGGILYEPEVND